MIVSPARSFGHLEVDTGRMDRLTWVQPEKWYSLTEHSAQWQSPVRQHRESTNLPMRATKPSDNPYSLPPARINKFSDISPNPKLQEGSPKFKHRGNASAQSPAYLKSSSHNQVVSSKGLVRKCHNPFNEGWKLRTFKPTKERLVPYEGKVTKLFQDRGFGFLEYQRQVSTMTILF
jgi:hypothetical protein